VSIPSHASVALWQPASLRDYSSIHFSTCRIITMGWLISRSSSARCCGSLNRTHHFLGWDCRAKRKHSTGLCVSPPPRFFQAVLVKMLTLCPARAIAHHHIAPEVPTIMNLCHVGSSLTVPHSLPAREICGQKRFSSKRAVQVTGKITIRKKPAKSIARRPRRIADPVCCRTMSIPT